MFRQILFYIAIMSVLCGLVGCTAQRPSTPTPTSALPDPQSTCGQPGTQPCHDLLKALSFHFQMDHELNRPSVQEEIHFLVQRPKYVTELVHNAAPYLFYVFSQTQKNHMPAEIALLPMVESNYDPFGLSHAGAAGLWQMMPKTASGLGLSVDRWYDGRRDILAATAAALKHLQYLHAYFSNWLLALAAYDAGDGTVRAAIRYNQHWHQPTDYWSLLLPTETKRYVPKLLALAAVLARPDHYGLRVDAIMNKPYFSNVAVRRRIALNQVSKLAGTDVYTIHYLNPALPHHTTAPAKISDLILPIHAISAFLTNLHHYEMAQRAQQQHTVRPGENLSQLAKRYHLSVATLQSINHLSNSRLHPGQVLRVVAHSGFNIKTKTHPAPQHSTTKHTPYKKQTLAKTQYPVLHHVLPKETLWAIAAHYHITLQQLRAWNHLTRLDRLHPHQVLIVSKPNPAMGLQQPTKRDNNQRVH